MLAAGHAAADRARPQLAGPAAGGGRVLRLDAGGHLDLRAAGHEAFPAVELARRAGRLGGTAPAVFNAANEECVDAFHDGRIGFLRILDIVEAVLEEHVAPERPSDPGAARSADVGSTLVPSAELSVELVLAADRWARPRRGLTAQHPEREGLRWTW